MPALDPDAAMTLLVIDDDTGTQALIAAIFRRHPVRVDHAMDGDAALERLRRESYHAVVLDLLLPGRGELDVIRELKHRDPNLLDRIIVITAASNMTLRDFDDVRLVRRIIRKPFDISVLAREVFSCAAPVSHVARAALKQHEH